MDKISQQEFINQAENQLEEQLKEVISVYQNLSEDVLLKPAPNNGWSITECLAHLNSYAEYYQPLILEAVNKSPILEVAGVFKHSILGRYFINSMDSARSKKKFKALKRHSPTEIGNPRGIVFTFIQHLENLLSLLREARNKNLRKGSIKTSISPWIKINTGDAIQFLLTHNKRHLDQAKRNL